MKTTLGIIGMLLLAWTANGQVSVTEGSLKPADTLMPAAVNGQPVTAGQSKKLNYGAQLGTSFTFSSGFGSGLNTYVSPYLTYQVSPKFRVKAGFSVINTQLFDYHPWFTPESGGTFSGNYTSALLYVQGQYQIGNRILLNGTAFKEFPLITGTPGDPYPYHGSQGFSLDVTYRIGEHMFLQAGFNYLKSSGPYYYGNPVYPSAPFPDYNQPFRW